ncbi:DUF2007 domain-containing protein [Brevundimonas sp.]|uniref:putative signal transducing protein n=1 Tax=Brevundimonas sp. TaxID=1871086 RepID=UPI00248A15E7|nr:DUF2007 domain-containing protein [Brevundimonas sp.]MDI1281351.1 hypothetical protein [Brevundimonas sp.]
MDRLEVARFSSLPEAEMAVGLLKRHGVDAQVADREMANSAPHLQFALGGLRVTAPDFQIVQARDLIKRVRAGEFDGDDDGEDDGWMTDHTPGRFGELDDSEVYGVIGSMKSLTRILIITVFGGSVAFWLFMAIFRG